MADLAEMEAMEEASRLAPRAVNRRGALARHAALLVALGLCGAAVRTRPSLARAESLQIRDAATTEGMDTECVSHDQIQFAGVLQRAAGYTAFATPGPGVLLTDAGQYENVHGGAYDSMDALKGVVFAYDELMEACLNDPSACYANFPETAPACELARVDVMPWVQITCVEDCVQDRFAAIDGGAYAHCADPIGACMFLAPELFKSCLVGPSACANCINACVADESAAPLVSLCTPAHAPALDVAAPPARS